MTRILRLSRLSPLPLLAAALVALAVFFVNYHDAPTAQAQTAEVEVWSATLTVQRIQTQFGCINATSGGECSAHLTDDDFRQAGVDYAFTQITSLGNAGLSVVFDKALPAAIRSDWTLHVDGSAFRFADANFQRGNTYAGWTNPGPSWTAGETVQLRLTAPNITMTASFSPDGPVKEDWETPSRDDLWSATLRARDLTTPESAPANVGCDDSQASARCSSALSPRNFTFKGVRYTVKAISYNQRKVTADTSTFTVKTYPESLKLTLDKTIPESLQSCLTLHVGDTKFGFGEVRQYATLSSSTTNDVDNDTVTWSDIGAQGWGLNWSAGDRVQLRLPNVGCLTLTLSASVAQETSMQWRRGGTTDLSGDYERISLPTFAAGSTSASTPIKPIDDGDAEGCETIILDMTMWPGEDRAVHERFTVAIQDDDGGNACVGGG